MFPERMCQLFIHRNFLYFRKLPALRNDRFCSLHCCSEFEPISTDWL